jgi:hypothetical protein
MTTVEAGERPKVVIAKTPMNNGSSVRGTKKMGNSFG